MACDQELDVEPRVSGPGWLGPDGRLQGVEGEPTGGAALASDNRRRAAHRNDSSHGRRTRECYLEGNGSYNRKEALGSDRVRHDSRAARAATIRVDSLRAEGLCPR